MNENQVVILDRGDYTTCAINLHGAVITSWRINNKEHIFLSRKSALFYLGDIQGGIGISFPHFGRWEFGTQDGFARDLPWKLKSGPSFTKDRDVQADFTLENDAYTESLWNFKFSLLIRITLGSDNLLFEIFVENKSPYIQFQFDIVQRSLLKVSDASKCKIIGLKGCSYVDEPTKQWQQFSLEDREEVTITKEIHRLYRKSPGLIFIKDGDDGKVIRLKRRNFPDLNLWNPWAEVAANISDMGLEEYKYFVAPESCKYGVHLAPLSCWRGSQSFQVIEPVGKRDMRTFYDLFDEVC